jgi:hypothetical protein
MEKHAARGRARQSRVKAGSGADAPAETGNDQKRMPAQNAPDASAPAEPDLRTRLYEGK